MYGKYQCKHFQNLKKKQTKHVYTFCGGNVINKT